MGYSQYKVIKEKNTEDEQKRKQLTLNNELLTMFIYFEWSMQEERVYIANDSIIYDDNMKECPAGTLGFCNIFRVDNSNHIVLKINDKEFLIKRNEVLKYRYLLIDKKDEKYILRYTNYFRKRM
ncbi:hypothetical protein Q765_00460 [Flavobacterium rivuli WB 3.3-2 = DSM 21788]|uniref:Uncharacterized protein n=1 Tax=Flavobacterium rivuli WB 3.3-2 = DSM 21788 TaxID=1121895 RepID=A0A0A2MJA3_9FLAO|nr:hypothetical protein [Flavobacterium rivuli]KGO88420.1 hypothetical protein Q765_00460 [Flavobacterium rivuli WB 3.3-2 = DSM 21788]